MIVWIFHILIMYQKSIFRGALQSRQGKYTDADPLYRRALEIDEQALGKNHPTTILHRNNLNDLLKKKR